MLMCCFSFSSLSNRSSLSKRNKTKTWYNVNLKAYVPLSNSTGKDDKLRSHLEDLGGGMTIKVENVKNNDRYLLPHCARVAETVGLAAV